MSTEVPRLAEPADSERTFVAWVRRYAWLGTFLAGLWLGGIVVAFWIGGAEATFATFYGVVTLLASGVAFVLYGVDKSFARTAQARRIAENVLHLAALLGGWPGAVLAQQLFRHKTSKPAFQLRSWFIIAIHLVVVATFVLLESLPWT